MAEVIILPIAKSILSKIGSLTRDYVAGRIKAVKSFNEDLKAMSRDLNAICAVLKDADAKQYSNGAMKVWLDELKSVVYDIDDLLDEVSFDTLTWSVLKREHMFTHYFSSSNPLFSYFSLSTKLKHLRQSLQEITARKDRFGLTERSESASVCRDDLDVSAYLGTPDVAGRDEAKMDIIRRLSVVADVGGLSVLPIVGMGGIGKTTLAKLVHRDIVGFDKKVWACVSDKFDLQKLLQDIVQDATGDQNVSTYTLNQLIEKLQEVFRGKRYFLVLDDLWEEDINVWNKLRNILNVGMNGSAILVTTRSRDVASNTQTIGTFEVDKLPTSICWSIFRKLAFAEGEEHRYPRLCEIGKSIVEKCGGIPLGVQAIGSLLRHERDESEWERIKNIDNLIHLHGSYDVVRQLLKLSFDKLPCHWKPCFAHLSSWAKDTKYGIFHFFDWSALGIFDVHDKVKDDVSSLGQSCLRGFVSRSILQDVEVDYAGTINSFKIHDLFYDIATDVLDTELCVVTQNDVKISDFCRHIAWGYEVLHELSEFPQQLVHAKKVRSFMFRYKMHQISESFLDGIISNMGRLRLLNLFKSKFKKLPKSVGRLKHLRLLNLGFNTQIKSLPIEICDLLNLETLFLGGCEQLKELPEKIHKLVNLRYLSLTTCQSSLTNTKFNKLPSLQHLEITGCKKLEFLWENDDICGLTSLISLYIDECPKLRRLPNCILERLAELKRLYTINCEELEFGEGEAVGGLHNLESLTIIGVPRLSCLPSRFESAAKSLKYMWIQDCAGLKELPNWFKSVTSLLKLFIWNCPNLLFIPEGFQCLKSLQELDIRGCPHLSKRCARPDGEDYSLIHHIPEIGLDGYLINY